MFYIFYAFSFCSRSQKGSVKKASDNPKNGIYCMNYNQAAAKDTSNGLMIT